MIRLLLIATNAHLFPFVSNARLANTYITTYALPTVPPPLLTKCTFLELEIREDNVKNVIFLQFFLTVIYAPATLPALNATIVNFYILIIYATMIAHKFQIICILIMGQVPMVGCVQYVLIIDQIANYVLIL